mmetsp:Transcript_10471/g.38569  ORF Transcript_10471/g.38569 Transcript_10471/m.38569 type:complete len:240 (+) Transcript_10471:531-1250(+)
MRQGRHQDPAGTGERLRLGAVGRLHAGHGRLPAAGTDRLGDGGPGHNDVGQRGDAERDGGHHARSGGLPVEAGAHRGAAQHLAARAPPQPGALQERGRGGRRGGAARQEEKGRGGGRRPREQEAAGGVDGGVAPEVRECSEQAGDRQGGAQAHPRSYAGVRSDARERRVASAEVPPLPQTSQQHPAANRGRHWPAAGFRHPATPTGSTTATAASSARHAAGRGPFAAAGADYGRVGEHA